LPLSQFGHRRPSSRGFDGGRSDADSERTRGFHP
jgi:hypothetical protein